MEKITGLTEEQVQLRRSSGKCNKRRKPASKSYKQIFFENIFSVFNFVNIALALLLLSVGSVKNCLFMLVVISNTLIGIVQEIRSKRVVDRLTIINAESVNVLRGGKRRRVPLYDLVIDDIIKLGAGDQIPNDCTLVSGSCEVNESLITGESDSIRKAVGDTLLSGSYIVSGTCLCRITAVGNENYADKLLGEIKYVKKTNSEIVRVTKRIVIAIGVSIVPIGGMLFYNQYTLAHNTYEEALVSTAAAIIGMIPEGLVLLISTVFAIGVIRLSKKNVLSQDLYSLEALARTDVLCLDKTGTLTTGEMQVVGLVPAEGKDDSEARTALSIIAQYSEDDNATIGAIRRFTDTSLSCTVTGRIPFSSERKWSAVITKEYGTLIMGAGEIIFGSNYDSSKLDDRYRAVALAVSHKPIVNTALPDDVTLTGHILLAEELRESIDETLRYFKEQDVAVKIISGDNPNTVRRLCERAFGNSDLRCIDMSQTADEDIPGIVEGNNIFGRVTPAQKRMIVAALKKNGHTVGMVGDGVNDVLALKESDCSAAIASGSAAARNTAQLVLLDSELSSLSDVVGEGRRSVNNLQNSASLFFVKTIFSAVMSVIFMIADLQYPFEPIQMTLISCLTIGFPSFVLSFLKNKKRISDSFLRNIIRNSVPAALTDIAAVMTIVLSAKSLGLTEHQISSMCVMSLAVTGIVLIIRIYRPLTPIKLWVLGVQLIGFAAAFILWADFFGMSKLGEIPWLLAAVGTADAVLLVGLLYIFARAVRTSE